jgi:glycine/D-amino acid oxidase-like deaminating enzyme
MALKVAVIGFGVIGASVARSLAIAGASVTLFERSGPATGTTGTSFAWINAHRKEPLAYHELNVAGMAEYAQLADHLDGTAWYFPNGGLRWATEGVGTIDLHACVQWLRERDYPVTWITPKQALHRIGDLRLPANVTDIAYCPTEGHVFPVPLLGRLWAEAREHGATLCQPAEVVVVAENSGAATICLRGGRRSEFDVVVIAVGQWTEALAATAGITIPMTSPWKSGSAAIGLLGYTCPLPTRLDCVLTTPRLNLRPDGGGRLVLQALDLNATVDPATLPTTDGPLAQQLRRRLADVLAGTERAYLESLRVGQRALPADGHTVAGFAGEHARLYPIVTHSGITLGPLLGRLATAEIMHNQPQPLLAPFRPQRFHGTGPSSLHAPQPALHPGEQ